MPGGADLHALFGPESSHVGASACFAAAVERRQDVCSEVRQLRLGSYRSYEPRGALPEARRRQERGARNAFTVDELECLLRADQAGMEHWAILREWQARLKQQGFFLNPEEKAMHVRQLLQIGLSARATLVADGKEVRPILAERLSGLAAEPRFRESSAPVPFFSFCTARWEDVKEVRHCWACNRCVDTTRHWHCGRCGTCQDHAWKKCKRCGGDSWELGRLRKEREALDEEIRVFREAKKARTVGEPEN